MTQSETTTTTEEQKQAIQKMLDIWNETNWSPLPEEAEQEMERAYEHLVWAKMEAEG